MVSESPPPLSEPPLSPPPQAVRASAVIAMPAVAASARRPPLETDLIRYLVFMGAGRGREQAPPRPPVAGGDQCLAQSISRASGLRGGCYAVVTGVGRTPWPRSAPVEDARPGRGRLSACRPSTPACSPSSPNPVRAC